MTTSTTTRTPLLPITTVVVKAGTHRCHLCGRYGCGYACDSTPSKEEGDASQG